MKHLFSQLIWWSLRFALCAIPALGHATPQNNFQPDHPTLFTVKGSNTVGAELLPRLAEDFMRANGLINIERKQSGVVNEFQVLGYRPESPYANPFSIHIAAHGSTTSFEGLNDGSADVGMSSRPIKATEVEMLASQGDMLSFAAEKVIAIDGLAIIVHPKNPIISLSTDLVAQIFSGKITNWKAVGGSDRPITLYARDENSGTWDTFKNLVLAKQVELSPSAERFESNSVLSSRVATDPSAIGFVGLAAVDQARALAINEIGIEPLLPTPATVATEDYVLSRRLFLYLSPNNDNPIIRRFIEFAQSTSGQTRVEQVGYISQKPILVAPDVEGITDTDYLLLAKTAQRLSVNIRFKAGSAELDNKAKQDILRLAKLMNEVEYQDKKLLLVGFGDAKQTSSRALVLSKLRATRVKSALYELSVASAPVRGYGDIMPVADNDKVRNQRVEIWLQ